MIRINRVTVFEIGINTFRIEMLGRVNCYLLYGTERGMLIDCGFGLEPFKPVIDKLCPVPYFDPNTKPVIIRRNSLCI